MTIIIDRCDLTYELVEKLNTLSTDALCTLAEHMLDTGHTSLGVTMVLGNKVDAILKEKKETR